VANIEMDAETLMAGRQQAFDGGERCGLDHVDHDRRAQDRDQSTADARCRVLGSHQEIGGSGEPGRQLR
jgi:hypothetical protein